MKKVVVYQIPIYKPRDGKIEWHATSFFHPCILFYIEHLHTSSLYLKQPLAHMTGEGYSSSSCVSVKCVKCVGGHGSFLLTNPDVLIHPYIYFITSVLLY